MKLYLSLLCTLLLSGCSMTRIEKYADYVNPVIGTDIQRHARGDKAPSEEKGQTMPAVGVPNGMTTGYHKHWKENINAIPLIIITTTKYKDSVPAIGSVAHAHKIMAA